MTVLQSGGQSHVHEGSLGLHAEEFNQKRLICTAIFPQNTLSLNPRNENAPECFAAGCMG